MSRYYCVRPLPWSIFIWIGRVVLLLGSLGATVGMAADVSPSPIILFDAATGMDRDWSHHTIVRATDYRSLTVDGRPAIHAHSHRSASGLVRHVVVDIGRCHALTWSWRVTALPTGADIRVRRREDVAAALYLMFGNPDSRRPDGPILRYAWGAGRTPVGTVVDSPFLPGIERTIVVEAGMERMATWITERRDVDADFRRAFGHPPATRLRGIALFTDSDQTGTTAEADYGAARITCE